MLKWNIFALMNILIWNVKLYLKNGRIFFPREKSKNEMEENLKMRTKRTQTTCVKISKIWKAIFTHKKIEEWTKKNEF